MNTAIQTPPRKRSLDLVNLTAELGGLSALMLSLYVSFMDGESQIPETKTADALYAMQHYLDRIIDDIEEFTV